MERTAIIENDDSKTDSSTFLGDNCKDPKSIMDMKSNLTGLESFVGNSYAKIGEEVNLLYILNRRFTIRTLKNLKYY